MRNREKLHEAFLQGKTNVLKSNTSKTFHGFRHQCPCCEKWLEVTPKYFYKKHKFDCWNCKTAFKCGPGTNGFKYQVWVRGKANAIPVKLILKLKDIIHYKR